MGTILVLSGSKKRPAGLVRERVLGRVSHLGVLYSSRGALEDGKQKSKSFAF